MKHNPRIHHRRSIRLKNYDYASPGAYFVTIVTHGRQCLFGQIVDGKMQLNECGEIVRDEWLKTEIIRPRVQLDLFVIMPNHIHGIIILNDDGYCMGTLQRAHTITQTQRAPTITQTQRAPTFEQFGKPTSDSIPTMIRLFKSATTKRINEYRNTPAVPVWQRNYYEHIIRNETEWKRIRQYIINNPIHWKNDKNYS
jgi:REP element-mobilizing transposase RayT